MTSLIAAGGTGRSTSVIPAVPAVSSVPTIALIGSVPALICALPVEPFGVPRIPGLQAGAGRWCRSISTPVWPAAPEDACWLHFREVAALRSWCVRRELRGGSDGRGHIRRAVG